MSDQELSEKSLAEFASTLRTQAAKEDDAKVAAALLASVEKVERINAAFWREQAQGRETVVRIRADMKKLRQKDQLPGWIVVAVLGVLLTFLFIMATGGFR